MRHGALQRVQCPPRRSLSWILRRGPVLNPPYILVVGLRPAKRKGSRVGDFHSARAAVLPLVDFGVAVGERKAATAVMQGAGSILPYTTIGVHFYGEGPIVDAVWMLVDQHPQVYGRWERHVRNLDVMSVHARMVILQVALILHAESLAHGK